MKLNPPPGCAHETERLHARAAMREDDGVRGRRNLVAVPLKCLEMFRERREHGVRARDPRQRDPRPPDLGRIHSRDRSARDLGEELRPEANAERRHIRGEERLQQLLLWSQPAVGRLLVGVHRTPEHDCGIETPGRR